MSTSHILVLKLSQSMSVDATLKVMQKSVYMVGSVPFRATECISHAFQFNSLS